MICNAGLNIEPSAFAEGKGTRPALVCWSLLEGKRTEGTPTTGTTGQLDQIMTNIHRLPITVAWSNWNVLDSDVLSGSVLDWRLLFPSNQAKGMVIQ